METTQTMPNTAQATPETTECRFKPEQMDGEAGQIIFVNSKGGNITGYR